MKNNIYTKVKDKNHCYNENINIEIENYTQDEIDAQIDECNTLNSLDDIYESLIIDVDDLNFELVCELKKRIRQSNFEEQKHDNRESSAKVQKYKYWINILNQIDGFITPRELNVLDKCISGYAAECCPYERNKEIRRNIFFLLTGCSEINRVDLLELAYKINHIDVAILFELTEILLELDNLIFCSYSPDDSQELSLSAFLYHWELSGIDYVQEYEIHTEICWVNNGLIQYYLEADGVDYFLYANGRYQPEYYYYTKQFNGQNNHDTLDLDDLECLCEDDFFKDIWLVAGKKFPELKDYFYEAEVTELCQDAGTECRDYFSEHEYDNYSKYKCYRSELGFFYCNKECCDECTHSYTEKIVNEQYILWEKYVQPIGLV